MSKSNKYVQPQVDVRTELLQFVLIHGMESDSKTSHARPLYLCYWLDTSLQQLNFPTGSYCETKLPTALQYSNLRETHLCLYSLGGVTLATGLSFSRKKLNCFNNSQDYVDSMVNSLMPACVKGNEGTEVQNTRR